MWSDWLKSWTSNRSAWPQARKAQRSNRRLKPQVHWLPQQVEELEARSVLTQITVTSLADAVADDGKVTLREAVQAANEDRSVDGSEGGNGADEIVFADSLVQVPAVIVLTRGEITIDSDLTIRGPGTEQLSISGRRASRIFRVGESSGDRIFDGDHTPESLHVLLTGLSLKHGFTGDTGAAVLNYESLAMANCAITGNSGGAIANNGAMSLTDCRVQNNSRSGIQNSGNLTLNSSVVQSNTHSGISNSGTLTLNSTVVADNTSESGGGLFNSGKATIRNSVFTGNHSTWIAGAICNSGEMTISETTVAKNSAVANGGIRNDDGKLTIDHCTITGNVADLRSGGIRNFHYQGGTGFVKLTNSILAGNSLSDGTPAEVFGNSLDVAHSRNNLIGDPDSSGGLVNGANGNIVGTTDARGGRTLLNLATVLFPDFVDDGSVVRSLPFIPGSPVTNVGVSVQPVNADDSNRVAVTVARPQVTEDGPDELEFRFSRLNTSGTLTVSYSISGSATLGTDYVVDGSEDSADSVRTATFPDGVALVTVRFNPTADDQIEPSESVTVSLLDGDGYTTGSTDSATELIAFDEALVVNTLADQSHSNPFDGTMSLRDAIDLANVTIGPNTIEFAPSLTANGPAQITLTGEALKVSSDISIVGPGADQLTISGREGVFYVPYWSTHVLTASSLTLTTENSWMAALQNEGTTFLDNVTLRGSHVGAENSGTLELNQCTVTGNTLGVSNHSLLETANCLPWTGKLTINQSVISDNVLGISNEGELVLRQSLITNNGLRREPDQPRGGIWNHSYSEEGSNVVWARASVEMDDSTITDNVGPHGRVANLFGNGLKRVISHHEPTASASSGSLPIDQSPIDQSAWEEIVDDRPSDDDEDLQAGTGSDGASDAASISSSDQIASSDSSSDEPAIAQQDTPPSDASSDSGDASLVGLLDQAFVDGIGLPVATTTNADT